MLSDAVDIDGERPQFNLTCISVGEPATTVTWTRDMVTVHEGADTVIDNSLIAKYNHTLTVTGRLGGLYTCSVANDKPSMANSTFNVKGIDIYSCIFRMYVPQTLQLPRPLLI